MLDAEDFYRGFDAQLKANGIRHFTARELCRVGRTPRGKDRPALKPPPKKLWPNAIPTLLVMDAAREHFGAPCIVHSGYRDPAYNLAVKGAGGSLHSKFNGFDFHVADVPHVEVALWIKENRPEHPCGLILYEQHVHFDTRGRLGLYYNYIGPTKGPLARWWT